MKRISRRMKLVLLALGVGLTGVMVAIASVAYLARPYAHLTFDGKAMPVHKICTTWGKTNCVFADSDKFGWYAPDTAYCGLFDGGQMIVTRSHIGEGFEFSGGGVSWLRSVARTDYDQAEVHGMGKVNQTTFTAHVDAWFIEPGTGSRHHLVGDINCGS